MRLVRPNDRQPSPVTTDGGWLVPKPVVPSWLRDRLDYDGIYVHMECGHKDRVTAKWVLIRPVFPDSEVLCLRCNRFRRVLAHMNLRQYLGVPDSEDTQDPMF